MSVSNSHYERIMLQMAEESDGRFLKDKIVADFGCGPRGSLSWATEVRMRIGIDVLADRYADSFKSNFLFALQQRERQVISMCRFSRII